MRLFGRESTPGTEPMASGKIVAVCRDDEIRIQQIWINAAREQRQRIARAHKTGIHVDYQAEDPLVAASSNLHSRLSQLRIAHPLVERMVEVATPIVFISINEAEQMVLAQARKIGTYL